MGVIFRKPCDRLTFIYESTERSTVYFPACLVWGGLFFQFYGFVAEIFGLFLKGKVRLNQETRQFTCLSGLWTQRTQQWAKQTRQVHRGAMKRQGSGAGNKRWGYGAEKMPGDFRKWGIRQSERWQKTLHLDLRNTCKDRLKISAACKVSRRSKLNNRKPVQRYRFIFHDIFSSSCCKWNNSRQQNPTAVLHSGGEQSQHQPIPTGQPQWCGRDQPRGISPQKIPILCYMASA